MPLPVVYCYSINNTLEFIDTADMTTMNTVEHVGVTDVEWDPTGRYVTSAVSYWTQKVGSEKVRERRRGCALFSGVVGWERA